MVISRSGEVIIADDNGRERERHKVPYGATLQVVDGDAIKAGKIVASWDPHHRPIITEYGGTVKFEHVEENVTVAKQIDDVTGLSTLVVIDVKRRGSAAAKGVRPSVKLLDRVRRGSAHRRDRPRGEHQLPGGSGDRGARRPAGADRRGAGAHSAGSVEDARHHGRSAAGGRAVRGARAEGQGGAGRVHRHRLVRQGHQGQAAPGDHRPGGRAARGADPEGQARAGARRPGGEQGRDDRRRLGRSARPAAPARGGGARALHHRRGAGRLPSAGREDQRQAHRGHRAPDAAARADRGPGRDVVHPGRAGRARRRAGGEREGGEGRQEDRRPTPTCCSASPRPRCRPTRSSRRPPSRRPRAC